MEVAMTVNKKFGTVATLNSKNRIAQHNNGFEAHTQVVHVEDNVGGSIQMVVPFNANIIGSELSAPVFLLITPYPFNSLGRFKLIASGKQHKPKGDKGKSY